MSNELGKSISVGATAQRLTHNSCLEYQAFSNQNKDVERDREIEEREDRN
jgi:hypothetical protein